MPKKFETIRKMEILKDFPEGKDKPTRYKKGEVAFANVKIAEKLEKAGVAKVSKYNREAAIEAEKKAIASAKKKQKDVELENS